MAIYSLLDELEAGSRTTTAKGDAFERLIATHRPPEPRSVDTRKRSH